MVRLPTRAAGLRFEEDFATNERLDDMLRDAAAARPELLPLLQFTLEELYQRRREDGTLTLAAYRELGGVEGSLARRAETVFEYLSDEVQVALPRVLDALIHVRREGQEAIGRRRARQSDFDTPAARQLLNAFIEARLFVTELDEDGQASVMVTHEALLWHWPRVKEWIEQNRENLRIHSRINAAAELWIRENRSQDLLLPPGRPLYEGKALLESSSTLTSYESAFIEASMLAARRRQNIKRGVVAGVAGLAVIASLAAVFANQQRQAAEAARVRAEVESVTAQRTADFLVGLFEVSDPSEARGREITAAEILQAGATRIDLELRDEPEIQARLLETMGKVYTSLGALNDAEPLLRRSLDARRRLPADAHADIAANLSSLGYVLALKASFDEAERAYQEALTLGQQVHGASHPAVAETLTGYAYLKGLQGEFSEAETLLNQALQIRRTAFGEQHVDVAYTLQELGMNQFDQGNFEQAEELVEEALVVRRKLLGMEPHPQVAGNLNNLAFIAYHRGDLQRATDSFLESLAMKRAMLPEDNNEIAVTINNIAVLMQRRGELEAAERMFLEALQIQRRVLGPTHSEVTAAMNNLASLLHAMNRDQEAIAMAREAIEIRQQHHPGNHPQTAIILLNLGQWLSYSGQAEQAEAALRKSLAMREQLLAEDHPDLAASRVTLANHLVETGRAEEGCALGAGNVAQLSEAFGEGNLRVGIARSLEGACLHANRRFTEAEMQLLASLEVIGAQTANMAYMRQALRRTIRLYEDWERPGEAARFRQQLTAAAAR
jgi:tetratricopeptide (TPR) repeat protein